MEHYGKEKAWQMHLSSQVAVVVVVMVVVVVVVVVLDVALRYFFVAD